MLYKTEYISLVGKIILVAEDDSLIASWIEGQKYLDSEIVRGAKYTNDLEIFEQTKDWLGRYFSSQMPDIRELKISLRGSEFRKIVWQLLCQIPYGETVTYKYLAENVARIIGRPKMSAQAVGGAVGHNPISIIIPCHRVLGSDGSMTGYAGGIDIKAKLLQLEGASYKKPC